MAEPKRMARRVPRAALSRLPVRLSSARSLACAVRGWALCPEVLCLGESQTPCACIEIAALLRIRLGDNLDYLGTECTIISCDKTSTFFRQSTICRAVAVRDRGQDRATGLPQVRFPRPYTVR